MNVEFSLVSNVFNHKQAFFDELIQSISQDIPFAELTEKIEKQGYTSIQADGLARTIRQLYNKAIKLDEKEFANFLIGHDIQKELAESMAQHLQSKEVIKAEKITLEQKKEEWKKRKPIKLSLWRIVLGVFIIIYIFSWDSSHGKLPFLFLGGLILLAGLFRGKTEF